MKSFKELAESVKLEEAKKHHKKEEKKDKEDDGYERTEEGHVIIKDPIHFKYPNGQKEDK